MKDTMNITINGTQYNDVPMAIAMLISDTLKPFKADKAKTTKSEPKTKAEPKQYAKVYALCEDGKSVTIGNDGYIPAKVFKGVTYSLKQAGAKYDSKTKAWTFENKTKCKSWCKAQDNR